MKLQLYLNGMEVELNESVSLPITKTYESLSNPTNIHIDYSKSINIPITPQNTKIFGQIFKLDRVISVSDIVGLNFDPTKRIDCQLIYNGDLLMDGYAKFVSVSNSVSNRYFTVNLFGRLGDIFQKMLQVVVDESKLPNDTSLDYVLDDHIPSETYLNKEFIYDSWMNNTPVLDLSTANPTDIIGFAPTYHGYDPNFDSKSIQINSNTIVPIENHIENKWKQVYKSLYPNATTEQVQSYVDSLGISELVGDGFKDYEMSQYRSYNQKPYIYFNKLVQMFQETFPKITDYQLKLDSDWFNVNNPYWYRLCYMLDYIDVSGLDNSVETTTEVLSKDIVYGITKISPSEYKLSVDQFYSDGDVKIQPFIFTMETSTTLNLGGSQKLGLGDKSAVKLEIYNETLQSTRTIFFVREDNTISSSYFGNSEVYYVTETSSVSNNTTTTTISCPVPYIQVESGLITLTFSVVSSTNQGVFKLQYFSSAQTNPGNNGYRTYLVSPEPVTMKTNQSVYVTTTRSIGKTLSLKNLYKKDTPLFEIILQYTKMMGLVWDIDYINQEVWIKTKYNYFKDYTVTDWSNKLDRTNEFIITPVTFDSNSVIFNYEKSDGYIYGEYESRYNSKYGERILYPEYEFNTDSKELFKGINPSIVSSRTHKDFYEILGWNLTGDIEQITDSNTIIEDSDKEDKSPLGLNNWYFRCSDSVQVYPSIPTFITDDSNYQIGKNQNCYYLFNNFDNSVFGDYVLQITSIPKFSVVCGGYGCIFNKPMEDYTSTGEITNTNNYIYDLQWNDYINERYSIQNKKLSTYLDLNIVDISNFKYSNFITISNQLFMVNKIFDFKLEDSTLTKVELEQVTDTNSYTSSGIFPPIYTLTNAIEVDLKDQYGTTIGGRFTIILFTDERPYAVEISDSRIMLGTSVKYNDRIKYIFTTSTGMNNSTNILYETITFRSSYGTLTIPVTVVGGGVSQ